MPVTFRGGSTLSTDRQNYNYTGRNRNAYLGFFKNFSSVPNGTQPPYSFIMPIKSGGLAASAGRLLGAGQVVGDAALGAPIEAQLDGGGTISSSQLNLVVAIAATLVGTGAISNAPLDLIQALIATLSGSGGVTNAQLDAIVNMIATLAGQSTLTSNPTFTAEMSADITPFTTLSPENLARAVWNELKNNHTTPESMGKILQDLETELKKKLNKTTFIALK